MVFFGGMFGGVCAVSGDLAVVFGVCLLLFYLFQSLRNSFHDLSPVLSLLIRPISVCESVFFFCWKN